MMFNSKAIVRAQFSAHSLMFNVSLVYSLFLESFRTWFSDTIVSAYGIGDDVLNPDAPQALLSDIISNALPQPIMKDGKMNNDLSVSLLNRFLLLETSTEVSLCSISQKYYKMEVPKVPNRPVQAA